MFREPRLMCRASNVALSISKLGLGKSNSGLGESKLGIREARSALGKTLPTIPTTSALQNTLKLPLQLQIPESTADKQIARFLNAGLLIKQVYGSYVKKVE
jgi:hypothetical protein